MLILWYQRVLWQTVSCGIRLHRLQSPPLDSWSIILSWKLHIYAWFVGTYYYNEGRGNLNKFCTKGGNMGILNPSKLDGWMGPFPIPFASVLRASITFDCNYLHIWLQLSLQITKWQCRCNMSRMPLNPPGIMAKWMKTWGRPKAGWKRDKQISQNGKWKKDTGYLKMLRYTLI